MLCLALFISGFVAIYLYPTELSQTMFVDENALQPEWSIARVFENSAMIKSVELIDKEFHSTIQENNEDNTMNPSQWICDKFSQMGMENFRVDDKIVYGIYRSDFSDSKMSVMIVLVYDSNEMAESNDISRMTSISAMIGLIEYMMSVAWCSKDIMFVFVDKANSKSKDSSLNLNLNSDESFQSFDAFIDWHFTTDELAELNGLNEYELNGNKKVSNNFVGGLIIDVPLYLTKKRQFDLLIGTENGIQPNLDMLSTVLVSFGRNKFEFNGNSVNIEKSMMYQAISMPNGYHSSLIKHQIDAVTIFQNRLHGAASKTSKNKKEENTKVLIDLMRSTELYIHTMSNLIEILHHSTFNYILVSPIKFITMAKYFPGIGLIGISPIIASIYIYKFKYNELHCYLHCALIAMILNIINGIICYCTFLFVSKFSISFALIGCLCSFLILFYLLIKCSKQYQKDDYLVSQWFVIYVFGIIGQMWLPIAINYSAGLACVLVTVTIMFATFVQGYSKICAIIYVICLPMCLIYLLSLLLQVNMTIISQSVVENMIDDNLQHVGWIVAFFVIVPVYSNVVFNVFIS